MSSAIQMMLVSGVWLLAAPTMAQDAETARSTLLEAVVACRAEVSEPARLACYDRAVAALDVAERSGDLTVVDREQVRQARRSLFGFDAGDLNIFRGRGGDDPADEALETRLVSARQTRDGWLFTLENGAVWRQTDSEPLRVTPRAGMPVRIRRAAMGSYMLSVDGARSLRAQREQ